MLAEIVNPLVVKLEAGLQGVGVHVNDFHGVGSLWSLEGVATIRRPRPDQDHHQHASFYVWR